MEIRREQLTRYITPLREGGSLPALGEASDELKWIKAEIYLDPAKLAVFNCAHSIEEIRDQFAGFLKVAAGDRSGGPMAELPVEERFRWLSAVKSACLATSRPHPGLTSDPEATFRRLFAEQVK